VTLIAGGADRRVGGDGNREVDLARAATDQAAVAIKKIEVLHRLTEQNLIRESCEQRMGASLEGRAARLGFDLDLLHVVVVGVRADTELERALASFTRGSLLNAGAQTLRALIPVATGAAVGLLDSIRALHAELDTMAVTRRLERLRRRRALGHGFGEARHASLGGEVMPRDRCVLSYDELGPYRYLSRIALDPVARHSTVDAVAQFDMYDRERSASLLATLEESSVAVAISARPRRRCSSSEYATSQRSSYGCGPRWRRRLSTYSRPPVWRNPPSRRV
jgi:hypothetical protein